MQSHPETDGERAVKACLVHLGLKYIQEYRVHGLKGDTKEWRDADFYLPDYGVVIEYLGCWDHPDPVKREWHRTRYRDKMAVYHKNNVRFFCLYPSHLKNTSIVIQSKLKSFDTKSSVESASTKQPEQKPGGYCERCGNGTTHRLCKKCRGRSKLPHVYSPPQQIYTAAGALSRRRKRRNWILVSIIILAIILIIIIYSVIHAIGGVIEKWKNCNENTNATYAGPLWFAPYRQDIYDFCVDKCKVAGLTPPARDSFISIYGDQTFAHISDYPFAYVRKCTCFSQSDRTVIYRNDTIAKYYDYRNGTEINESIWRSRMDCHPSR